MKDIWYDNLNKSPLTPPSITFSILWPILYLFLAISFILTFKKTKSFTSTPILLFISQMILNFSWTTIFFTFKQFTLSFFIILFIIILTSISFFHIYKIQKIAAFLLIPYLLWLSFASYLNFYIITHN